MQQYYGVKKENNKIILNNDDLNHIKNVMRMKTGDNVIVVYDDKSYVCSLNSDLLSCTINEVFKENESNSEIVMYIPLLQEEKMSFILQHGTELGISEFVVVQYSHCKYKLKRNDYDKKLNRWTKIVKEASEQSYRIRKPIINKIIDVDNILANKNVNILCSLYNKNVKSISEVLTTKNCCDTINVVFGPEGGLSEIEENKLVDKGYVRTTLGDTVLRTETVPLMIASIIKYLKDSD